MSTSTRVASVANEDANEEVQTRVSRIDRVWAVIALSAAGLFAVASFLPLWSMTLRAPQYPEGLSMTAYGWRIEGDLGEINSLNHYVGIQRLDPDAIPELALFPFAAGALVAALVVVAFVRRPALRWLVIAGAWAMPLGMLVDLQWWLHRFGRNLDPTAPIRLDPFTPKVLGTTSVINFHSEAMVAIGFWLMLLAAAALTFGPWIVRFTRESWANTGTGAQAAIVVLALLAGAWTLSPSEAVASEQQSIGAAIAAAAPGDTVVISAGTYVEPLVIDKPIVLVGEGRPVIDGGGAGDVVRITAEDVTLRGFVIQNSARNVSAEPTGIRVTADRATIEDNEVREVLYGIALQNSNGHTVHGNTVQSFLDMLPERRGHAIYIWYSQGNAITENFLQYAKDGIFLGFASSTAVEGNTVTRLRYGLHTMYASDIALRDNAFRDNVAGASLMYSRNLVVEDNEFSGNRSPASGYGLLFKDMDNVELVGNRIHHNRLGLTMEGAPQTPGTFVTLRDNFIGYNQIAMELFSTTSVTFTGNSFVGNLQQVESRGGSLEHRNAWSLDGRGNYWDDYRGYDADGDGVGDIAYRYEGSFDELVRRNEAVRAYTFTPARSALDLAARWFPIHRPAPRVVDEHPLIAPAVGLSSESGQVGVTTAVVSVALVLVPLAVFLGARRQFRTRWA